MTNRLQKLKDLGYELQLLFSANLIIDVIEGSDNKNVSDSEKFGNIVNLLKDSVYLHSRNLLNALTNQYLTEIGNIPSGIYSELFKNCKPPLECYVTHIKQARDQKDVSNIIGDKHLNEYVHDLSKEVEKCWKEWIKKVGDPEKKKLQDILDDAHKAAEMDKTKFIYLMKVSQ